MSGAPTLELPRPPPATAEPIAEAAATQTELALPERAPPARHKSAPVGARHGPRRGVGDRACGQHRATKHALAVRRVAVAERDDGSGWVERADCDGDDDDGDGDDDAATATTTAAATATSTSARRRARRRHDRSPAPAREPRVTKPRPGRLGATGRAARGAGRSRLPSSATMIRVASRLALALFVASALSMASPRDAGPTMLRPRRARPTQRRATAKGSSSCRRINRRRRSRRSTRRSRSCRARTPFFCAGTRSVNSAGAPRRWPSTRRSCDWRARGCGSAKSASSRRSPTQAAGSRSFEASSARSRWKSAAPRREPP